jgi:DNA-binding CsgD family transcriptional regulator
VTHPLGARIGRTPNVQHRPIPIFALARPLAALVRRLPTRDNPHVGGGMVRSRFVGRANELGLLTAGLDAIHEGRATTFVIAGEAGVGKTRLIEEFLARAEAAGAVGLVGGCLDLEEGRLPFGPFIEALRPGIRQLDPAARHELAALGGGELAALLPELALGEDATPATATVAQGRLFELVLSLLNRLASADPLAIVLEDVHWSDRSTRDLLAFLARNLRGERVQLIATYRSDELFRGHPLRSFLAELERNRRVQRIDLEPFTRDEVGEQLADILGDSVDTRLVDSVFERSQGNAFLAEELVAAGARSADHLPPTLRDILLMRSERLPAGAQELLRVVAVGGRLVSDRLLAVVSPLEDSERLEALHEAASHHVLESRGFDGYAFRHELVREAIYHELLPEERSRLHAAYGEVLSASPGLASDPNTVVGDLARHWFAAHDLPRALAASVDAGTAAERRSGFAEAQRHYERALELWEQVGDAEARSALDWIELHRRAAEAANLAGDSGRAAALVRTAIAQLDAEADPVRAGILWQRLGRFLWAAGDGEAAFRAYEQAERLVPAEPPSTARARVLAARGQGLMLVDRHEESMASCVEAIAIARRVGARAEEGHARNTLGVVQALLGNPSDGVTNLRESLRIAQEVGDIDDLCRAYLNLSECLAGPANRLEEGLQLALEGAALSQRRGTASDYGVSIQCNAATALIRLGRFRDADEILRNAESRNPSEIADADLRVAQARLEVCSGAFTAATAHIGTVRLMTNALDPPYDAPLRALEAEIALWQGQPGDALRAVAAGLEKADSPWLAAPLVWLGLWAYTDQATAPRRAGMDTAPAGAGALDGVQLLEQARALLAGPRPAGDVTRGYVALCEAEAARLSEAGAAEPWRAVSAVWASLSQPYLEVYAQLRQAEALLARRQASDGSSVLRCAYEAAGRLGADHLLRELTMLAQRARIKLAPASHEATDAPADNPTGLTARQLEVLALLAEGQTNREIAETLFITEKTAGAHVSSILARLGVRSRVEAATTAHRLGIDREVPD